jgi:hypothetical protein
MNHSSSIDPVRGLVERLAVLEAERRTWAARQRLLVERHGRAVALGIALRHIRSARTPRQLLGAIEEILVQHVGVEAFAVIETSSEPHRVLASRGMPADEEPGQSSLAVVPLGAGEWVLGSLVIYSVIPRKIGLDVSDFELLDALGPQIAVALHGAGASPRSGPAGRSRRKPPAGEQ